MRTGNSGHTAISWTQTEVDGLEAAPLDLLVVGAAWSWRGRAIVLATELAESVEQAAASGMIAELANWSRAVVGQVIPEQARIEFSNGAQKYVAKLAMVVGEAAPVLVFEDGCPEPGQEFWVCVAPEQVEPVSIDRAQDSTVISFPSLARTVPDVLPDMPAVAAE